MNNGTSTVILVLAVAVSSGIRRTERKLIDTLEAGGAVTPDKAIALDLSGWIRKQIFRRLLNNGAVGETMDQRQYVDVVAYAKYRWRRTVRGLVAAGVVIAGWLAFYLLRRS